MIEDPDRVIAKLRLPARVDGIDRVVRGLEKMYGKGLVIVTDGPLFEPGWLVIATPHDGD